ncbi:hypothetical protein FA15DRAFT_709008 [Coprinopsis marcescibilis]|uniref:HMG box domain-containing protein n=1 Tax=Coprinopsis marcescibilis TaxID=230819 RepID=A0A5C3KGT4_COPMA|nr:hypothetical protein FA15DRAFT_709008 [Coprinopsis marcescibilis]
MRYLHSERQPGIQRGEITTKNEQGLGVVLGDQASPTPHGKRSFNHPRNSSPGKRPRNAFMFFRTHYAVTTMPEKEEAAKANGYSMGGLGLSEGAGAVWHSMSREEKRPFIVKSKREAALFSQWQFPTNCVLAYKENETPGSSIVFSESEHVASPLATVESIFAISKESEEAQR